MLLFAALPNQVCLFSSLTCLFLQLQAETAGGRIIFHLHSMNTDDVKGPLGPLIEKTIGMASVARLQSCLISDPRMPFSCNDPLPVKPNEDTLEGLILGSRYLLAKVNSAGESPSFIQRSSFLARIRQIRHLRQN